MKIDRLIAITMYLLNREIVSASVLAQRFEVSKRTIQRDIEALNLAGIPIASTYGAEGGYEILDGFKLVKSIAGVEDYLNIITALRGLSTAYESDKVKNTLEKALAAMGRGQQRIFIDFSIAREGINRNLAEIEKAVNDKTPLTIEYCNARQVTSTRLVEPLALSYQWYAWYMFAYCHEKRDYRLFKLARITKCQPTSGSFIKEHGSIEQLMKDQSADEESNYHRIRILCSKEIRPQVREYLNFSAIEEQDDGDFIITMDVPLERMWISLVLGFGDKVKVLEPEELKALLRQKAEEILTLYK